MSKDIFKRPSDGDDYERSLPDTSREIRRYPNRDLIRELARRHAQEILVTAKRGDDLDQLSRDQDDELIKILEAIPRDDRPAFEQVYHQEADLVVRRLAPEAEKIADSRDNVVVGYVLLAAAIFFGLGILWQYLM